MAVFKGGDVVMVQFDSYPLYIAEITNISLNHKDLVRLKVINRIKGLNKVGAFINWPYYNLRHLTELERLIYG